jgi:hypothetical protein
MRPHDDCLAIGRRAFKTHIKVAAGVNPCRQADLLRLGDDKVVRELLALAIRRARHALRIGRLPFQDLEQPLSDLPPDAGISVPAGLCRLSRKPAAPNGNAFARRLSWGQFEHARRECHRTRYAYDSR